MKKKLLYIILAVYLLFIVSIPLFYFFIFGPTQNYRFSLAFDTKSNTFFLIGDEFVLNKVLLNDKDIAWQKKDNVYRSVNIDYTGNKLYRLFIKDKQDNYFDINFRFPKSTVTEKKTMDFSCKTTVTEPQVTINNDKFSLFEGAIDTDYVFTEKSGDIIKVKNIVLDIQYQTESSKVAYSKFFKGVLGETIRLGKVSWHFFVELNKYIYRASYSFFKFLATSIKPISSYIVRSFSFMNDIVYRNDKSLFEATKYTVNYISNRLLFVGDHSLSIFRNNYLFAFVNNIGENTNNIFANIHSNTSDIFRSANNYLHKTVVADRIERKKKEEVSVIHNLSSKLYKVGAELNEINFSFVNGLGEPIVNERVKVSFKSRKRNNALLLSPMTTYTDASGNVKIMLRFGHKVSEHELKIQIMGKRFVYNFDTEPDSPFIIKDLTNRPMLFQKAGRLVKRAFYLRVYDQYNNIVPGAKVELLEQDIDSQNEPFIFAEAKADSKGNVQFDYRMNDNSGRVLIIAKLADAESRFVYTVQSESTKPVELEAVSEEEVEAIIGIPLRSTFRVRAIDDNGNPCPYVPVEFSFQTSMFEQLESKKARTDKNGVAEVEFRTPEVVGYFQVIANSPKVPDYEVAFVVLVMPGDAAKMNIVTGDKQTVEWETNSEPMLIQVVDDKNNPIPNAEVKWSSPRNVNLIDYDEITDLDGQARAIVKVNETERKEVHVVAQVGKVKEGFKLYPKQPSFYKLYLLSNPVVNVFTNQMLADPIEFVLRDQYGNVLADEKVSIEYIVYKRGVQYLQNYDLVTNKEGKVSFNFIVSDQNDVINLKGKYYVEGKPRITWVKINVIPEEISNIVVPPNIVGIVGNKLDKPIQIFVADNNAAPVVDIFLSISLKKAPLGVNMGNVMDQTYQIKTNKQGMAEFNPILGEAKGEYIYTAKINTLEKDIVIQAKQDKPFRIRIVAKENARFPVFREVDALSAQFYDKYDNLITEGNIVYNINTTKKVLKHDFNKVVAIDSSGLTRLPFQVPEKKGIYFVYITDENYLTNAFYRLEAYESGIDSLILLATEDRDKQYIVGRQYRSIFRTRVLDRFGNFVEKSKLSLDLYKEGTTTSSVGADAFTDENGVAAFDIRMPETSGRYNLVIYSDDDSTVRQALQILVQADEVYSAFVLSGDNQIVDPDSVFPEDFAVKIIDRFDNPVTDEQVRWSYAIDVRGENRQYVQTIKTNQNGISTFNFKIDKNPGVREVRAYYRKDRKWEYVSFYIKVTGLSVDLMRKIAGDNQTVLLGRDVSDFYVVKAFDVNANPIQDMPIIFRMIDEKKEGSVILEKSSRTDANGIARQKFSAPVEPGNYKILVFPQFQENKAVVFDLTVSREDAISKEDTEEIDKSLLRIVALQPDRIVIKIGDNSILGEVMVVDRFNNPIVDTNIDWEIYDIIRNTTYTRKTKTNKEGKTWLPEVNRMYERKFVIKAIEPYSGSSVIFNVDIVKNLGDDVSFNFLNAAGSDDLTRKETVLKDLLEDKQDAHVFINNEGVQVNIYEGIELFVGQKPYLINIYNEKETIVVGDMVVGNGRIKEKFTIGPNSSFEFLLSPDVIQNSERVKVSVVKNRMVPWIKDSNQFIVNTNQGSFLEIQPKDILLKSYFPGQKVIFSTIISPLVELVEQYRQVDVEISIVSGQGRIESYSRTVEVDKDYTFEHIFDLPGLYKVVFSSYLFSEKLEYTVKVFEGDYLLKSIEPINVENVNEDTFFLDISFEVINRTSNKKVVNDFILWELVERPLGAVLDFQRRTNTDESGVAKNLVKGSLVQGKYVIRARRLFVPDEYLDFVFNIE